MTIIVGLARIILSFFLLSGGILKLLGYSRFQAAIAKYDVKRPRLLERSYPFAELVGGVFVATGFWLKVGAVLALVIYANYLSYVIAGLRQKRKLADCGCFGGIVEIPLSWKNVVADLVLIACALILFLA